MFDVILSIVIVSHNQKFFLKRCIDSILYQKINYKYEIVVSDDNSEDGTSELLCDYAKLYPDVFRYFICNSDLCKPSMISERAGYNRFNAYKRARGKYIVHIDGDDYFTSKDILNYQVEILEEHPECTICCQNYRIINDGESISTARIAFDSSLFENRVISQHEFIVTFPYIHNSTCCLRRNPNVQFVDDYHIMYDDVDITFLHIGNGAIYLINRADFIYVRYNFSTASKFSRLDQRVSWLLPVAMSTIAPQCVGSLLRSGISNILSVVNLAKKNVKLEDATIIHIKKWGAFIFNCFDGNMSVISKLRLYVLWLWLHFIKRTNIQFDCCFRFLYKLAIRYKIPDNVYFGKC